MVTLIQRGEEYLASADGTVLGSLRLYHNPFHRRNCYVELALRSYDPKYSAELFDILAEKASGPLQVMVSSEETDQAAFLLAGGFVCRRRCFETEAVRADFLGGRGKTELYWTHAGDGAYGLCCRRMFEHYQRTHEAVNPWTAGYDAFCAALPGTAVCSRDGAHLAFVEDSEIAYAAGSGEGFRDFAESLLDCMFARYETVFFESDDCDPAAMMLRAWISSRDEASFDTYLRERPEMPEAVDGYA